MESEIGAQTSKQQQPQQQQPQKQQSGSAMDVLNLTNTALAILIVIVLYKLFGAKKKQDKEETFRLPDPLPKHDMTLDELRRYDGTGPDKRVCIAILGRVYDCTKRYNFYGPGGAYSTLAGRDASRALAKFDVYAVKDEWDDITDLDPNELSAVMEWNEQFQEKYDYVGRLVRSKEEILERAEDNIIDDDLQTTDLQSKQQSQQHQSSTDDDEIEVINTVNNNENVPELSSNNGNKNESSSKKVSFSDAEPKSEKKDAEDEKKLSESSDDIEVIEAAPRTDNNDDHKQSNNN